MERGHKTKGNYESAYKLSGATRDRKGMRLQRRSIEQKELRFDEVRKRRNLTDLSPLHEGDSIHQNKNYTDKTPVKGNNDKSKKLVDRLEQLKKWKAERETKKKGSTQSTNKVFRVSAKVNYGDRNLFSQQQSAKRIQTATKPAITLPHKPVNKPVEKAVPTTQKSNVKTVTAPKKKPEALPTRTRQPSGSSRQTTTSTKTTGKRAAIKDSPRNEARAKPRQTKAETNQLRSTRSGRTVAPVSSTRVTRQTANKKVEETKTSKPKKEVALPDESRVTKRGEDSFAPPESSFVFNFKPLSPSSAAGFLCMSQDNTCTSFLETNPKRSSTPKSGGRSPQSACSNNVDKVTDKCSDTLQLDNTGINVTGFISQQTGKGSPKTVTSSKSPKTVKTPKSPKSVTTEESDETVVTTGTKEPDNEHVNSVLEETVVNTSTVRRSSRRSVVSSTLSEDKTTEQTEAPKSATKTRRSVCKSVTSGNSSESDSQASTEDGSASVALSKKNRVSKAEAVAVDVTLVKTPKSALKKPKITDSSNDATEVASSTKTATPLRRSSRRRSVTVEAEAANEPVVVSNVTPSRSSRKTSRRSVAVSFEPVAEVPETVPESQENSAVENDDVFADELKSAPDSNRKLVDFNVDVNAEKKSGKKGKRNKSFGGFRLPSADSVVLSAKRRGRKSMMPKSPEEWVNLLSNSPMIEMSRRRTKAGNATLPILSFDIDLDEPNSTVDESAEGTAVVDTVEGSSNSEVEPAHTSVSELGTSEDHDVTVNSVDTRSEETAKEAATVQVEEISSTQKDPAEDKHDVPYFRNLLSSETERLSALNKEWNLINDPATVPEDIQGQIRTTVGQALLLMNQRFKQFRGLVDDCEFSRGEKVTTCTDLQGFWDMIYFQVEDVDIKFAELRKLKANNWIDDKPKPVVKKVKKVSKPVTTKPVVKSKFAAFRKQMQQQKKADSPVVKQKEEEKVFEVPGFFTVASPVRTPKAHCEGGTPRKGADTNTGSGGPKININSADLLLKNHTPSRPRPSYIPAVPSPLLTDSTPQPRPSRTCTQKTPMSKRLLDVDDAEQIPNSASKRTRRSLRVQITTPDTSKTDTETDKPEGKSSDASLDRLLQPVAQPQAAPEESGDKLDDDFFSKYLQPSGAEKENSPKPTKRRRSSSSSLKQCPSKERRRSHAKTVQFNTKDSPEDISHMKLPSTPFNSSSLVKQKRVTRRSVTNTPCREEEEEEDVFDTENINLDQNIQNLTAPGQKDPRPSLLFTPPELKRSPRVTRHVPTATLISFSP